MVSEEDEDDGFIARFQLLRHAAHFVDRAANAGKVVVDDAAGLHRPAGLFGRGIFLPVGLGGVGAVVLIRNREEEEGIVLRRARVDILEQVVYKYPVRAVERVGNGDEVAKARVVEYALVKAEVLVHVAAVIKPAVAGVAVERVVALRLKVADIGVDGAAELLVLAVAREVAPLGVHRAAGEDIGEKVSRNAALFQLVQRLVDLVDRADIVEHGEIRQVGEGLEHDADDGDLLSLRDILILIGRERAARLALAVAARRVGEHVLHAVEEGIGRAAREVDLRFRPGVDEAAVGGFFVNTRVGIELKAAGKRQREQQHQSREARSLAHALPAQQKD